MPSRIEITSQDVLLAIDLQADFMPGGALAVDGGDEIVLLVNRLINGFENVVRDAGLAPAGPRLLRFVSWRRETVRHQAPSLWRPDPVAGPLRPGDAGRGASPELEIDRAFLVLRKGMHEGIDSYSAFVEADRKTTTGLAALLQGARHDAGVRLRARDRFLRRLLGAGRARRRFRDLRDRRRLPGDRRQQFAGRGLGEDERRRGLAHPVGGNPRRAVSGRRFAVLAEPHNAFRHLRPGLAPPSRRRGFRGGVGARKLYKYNM